MRQNIPRMIEDRAGMQQRVEVEHIVFKGGRRPHDILHS
jgi:hypothetical protein